MPINHAILSASSAHRWLNCTKSPQTELEFKDKTSPAAEEGSLAHSECERKLQEALGLQPKQPIPENIPDDMTEYTDGYVDFVLESYTEAQQNCHDPTIQIEQRLDFSKYVPDGFGTADCIIIADGEMHIIDMKYGCFLVNSENNPQLMLYSLGALLKYDYLYDIKKISMTIYQPRRENVSTWTISSDELMDWAENTLKPRAELAHNGEGEYCAGEWCTFCRASTKCRARAEEKLKLAQYEFAKPPLLSDDEIEDILSRLDDLTKWANEIFAYAMESAINHGKQWTGFKLVEGRSIRKYSDENEVATALKNAGYTDIYSQSLLTITAMEKYLGKSKFNEILGNLVIKPQGKPTLVLSSDKRSAIKIDDVTNEFTEEK